MYKCKQQQIGINDKEHCTLATSTFRAIDMLKERLCEEVYQ